MSEKNGDYKDFLIISIRKNILKKNDLEKQYYEITRQINQLEHQIANDKIALKSYDKFIGNDKLIELGTINLSKDDESTTVQMIEELMSKMGGEARISELTRKLIELGKIPDNYRSSYSRIAQALSRSRKFEKMTSGLYTLVNKSETRFPVDLSRIIDENESGEK